MKTLEPVFGGLNGVDPMRESARARLCMDTFVFRDKRVNGIAMECIKQLVVASVVGTGISCVPGAWRRITQRGVLSDPLKVPLAPLDICVALKVGNVGRVVHQLMSADACQTNEVRQVAFKHLE